MSHLCQKLEFVKGSKVQIDDFVNDIVDRGILFVYHLIPDGFYLIQLVLKEFHNIGGLFGRVQGKRANQPMPTLVRLC